MACDTPFNVLRTRTEDLGEHLYVRASWRDPWLNLIPRSEWPEGAGLVRSTFEIGRSEPSTDEETWVPIATSSGGTFNGSCGDTFNPTYVGFKEKTYAPEGFALVGPVVCQDELTIAWKSTDFWEKYFQALEKRNSKSIINRLANIYMNYATKVVAGTGGGIQRLAGDITTQPPGSTVNLAGVDQPLCGLTQDLLDDDAIHLMELGATDPDSNGWINLGEDGPIFPILIGPYASNQLLLNNAELRQDYRAAFMGDKDINPVIKRLGASKVIKNWRHIITLFPPRWQYTGGTFTRVPTWLMSTDSKDATKGQVAVINPSWTDPTIANVEGAIALNPWVYTEEVLQPVNMAPGMKWTAQNYFGEWRFVTGNDAFIGFPGCTGIQDPLHTQGRHFARYRHGAKPIFQQYGRLYLFTRCANVVDCATCT